MTERTAMSDGRVDSTKLIEAGKAASKTFVHADFAAIGDRTGSVISAVLLGALAATGALPFERAQFEAAIRKSGVGVEASLAAFAAGFEAATAPPPSVRAESVKGEIGARLQALAARIAADFPPAVHEFLLAGVRRLADYQDESYAATYLDRLTAIHQAAADAGPTFHLLRETARYLALWMSYEDAIRVADLKIRRTRFERVHREVRAAPLQLVQINEYLHPRAQEIADILPAALGRMVLNTNWMRRTLDRFTARGRVLRTTSLRGFLQLYVLASMRPLRPKSLRFAKEHAGILDWLARVQDLAREDYALALEAAQLPGLLKGYGDTHANGSRNYQALIDALPSIRKEKDAAARLKQLRQLALNDESGRRLSDTLGEVGA